MMVFLAGVVGVAGTTGVLRAADRRTDDIERVDGLELVLTSVPDDGPAENYLLVGSDTREGVDPNSPDFGGIGDTSEVSGRRSDTIMILRRERDGGAALLSLPRDLWVDIAGTGESGRINGAYSEGPQRLASTITQSLGIPVHHYVEVDFVGFKRIIDQIGGVELCIEFATRDLHTGLDLQPGCQKLDGVQSLAFARSRYYEEFREGDWRIDARADLGRIERQQLFMRAAVNGALEAVQSSPFGSGGVLDAVVSSVRIDASVDPIKAGEALRRAAAEKLDTYTLPVYGDTVGDQAILRLGDGADVVLDYFRGVGPAPPPTGT
jgi:LCP family protein required for cell wall assembly